MRVFGSEQAMGQWRADADADMLQFVRRVSGKLRKTFLFIFIIIAAVRSQLEQVLYVLPGDVGQ